MLRICSLNVLVLYETLLVPVLLYGSETMLWKVKVRSRISAVQMDNLKGFLCIKRIDGVLNTQIREFSEVTKGVDERIDEGVLWPCGEDGE